MAPFPSKENVTDATSWGVVADYFLDQDDDLKHWLALELCKRLPSDPQLQADLRSVVENRLVELCFNDLCTATAPSQYLTEAGLRIWQTCHGEFDPDTKLVALTRQLIEETYEMLPDNPDDIAVVVTAHAIATCGKPIPTDIPALGTGTTLVVVALRGKPQFTVAASVDRRVLVAELRSLDKRSDLNRLRDKAYYCLMRYKEARKINNLSPTIAAWSTAMDNRDKVVDTINALARVNTIRALHDFRDNSVQELRMALLEADNS